MLARPGQKLDEEALGGLLAAAGNHEAKALLLSAMSEHIVYSANDLNRLMLECQGQYTTWRPSGQLPFDYCAHSLAPIGLVASEVLNADLTIYGFYKTRYGREFGNALAGHLLSFSERHPKISLIDLFGRANVATRKGRDEGGREEGEPPTRSPLKNYYNYLSH